LSYKTAATVDESRIKPGSVVEGFVPGQMTGLSLFRKMFAPECDVLAYPMWKDLSKEDQSAYNYIGKMFLERKKVDQSTGEVTTTALTPYTLFKHLYLAHKIPSGWPICARYRPDELV
jgi:hypothetical protein